MNENISNFNFLKDTVSKFKAEIQKMLTDANYSNTGIIQLKQNIEEIEKNISSQEKFLVNNFLSQKKSLLNNHKLLYEQLPLPVIRQPKAKVIQYIPDDEVYTTLKYVKQSKLDRLKDHKNKREINEERLQYIKNLKQRKTKGAITKQKEMRVTKYNNNKTTNKILSKYNINSGLYDNMKITSHVPNYMNSEKRLKYSAYKRKYNNNEVLYDKNRQPIIRKDELNKGLLNMVYKGIIPKGADLSPAFEANGHPMQLNMRVKEDFTKKNAKDEYIYDNNVNKEQIENDAFFITKQPAIINKNNTNSNNNINSVQYEESETNKEEENKKLTQISSIKEQTPIEIKEPKRRILLFSNYAIVKNNAYNLFYKSNQTKWGAILYLFEHFSKFFKLLNLKLVEVYEDKLLELIKDKMREIQNQDLLLCISDKDLKEKGLDPSNLSLFYMKFKEKISLKIQTAYRKYKAKKKLKDMKQYYEKIIYIQSKYLSSKLMVESRQKAKDLFEKRYNEWTEMMKNFKSRWELLKSMPRVEIHFNNITPNSSNAFHLNTTINKFTERENNQLNRIIGLNDNLVDIIYISPYKLNDDVISYYFSIMTTVGIKRVKERFHVLVPEEAKNFPPHYSISQLLLLSPKTLNKIKEIIGDREAYIIPGNGGKTEVEISIILNVPILMGDLYQSNTIFTKSGAKLIFEANEVNIPISAWDIKSEIEFYASLSHLIVLYPEYDTWVFKMDSEMCGRGIAYIQLAKIPTFTEVKRASGKYEDNKKYEVYVGETLKKYLSQTVKICAGHLYKSWDEYFNNFILYRGVIEACPTLYPKDITGSPCFPFLIEPNGHIELLPSYDKVNIYYFRPFGGISPQRTIAKEGLNVNINQIIKKIGKYLYEHNIIGYITLELIALRNENKLNFWAIDLKFGLNDFLSTILFCKFLYNHSLNKIQPENNEINFSYDKSISIIENTKYDIFTFPFLSHPKISELSIVDLTGAYRNEDLIFDIIKKKGIIFNFSDTLKCGSMGICGVLNSEEEDIGNSYLDLWTMIQSSFYIISKEIRINEFQFVNLGERRTDEIDIGDIISKVNKTKTGLSIKTKKNDFTRSSKTITNFNKKLSINSNLNK